MRNLFSKWKEGLMRSMMGRERREEDQGIRRRWNGLPIKPGIVNRRKEILLLLQNTIICFGRPSGVDLENALRLLPVRFESLNFHELFFTLFAHWLYFFRNCNSRWNWCGLWMQQVIIVLQFKWLSSLRLEGCHHLCIEKHGFDSHLSH